MDPNHALNALRAAARDLDDEVLARLIADLQAEIDDRHAPIPVAPGRTIADVQQTGGITDRQEYVRCGKSGCRCARGHLHGPYWYRYQSVNGKLTSTYLGKNRR
jgi:hypothetical protein